jgi:hypothetical protein
MTIQFMEPLGQAWNRMKVALFKPFDIHKWFVIGFNAFLCGLMDASNGSSGGRMGDKGNFAEFIHFPRTAWNWLMDNPLWASVIVFGVVVAIAVIVTLSWVSSRGVFMFLSSVVHDRVEIAKPWREYQKEGNSLFLWRLVFGVLTFIVFGGLFAFFFIQGGALYDAGLERYIPLTFVFGFGLVTLAVVLVWGYIVLFLKDFVAALMFKNRISAVEAWRVFLALLKKHPMHFIGYGILIFLLMLGFVFVVVLAGLVTCCIGWILLVIPYIGTVVTLPFWYLLRAFSLKFLAQFGPEYDVFPRPAAPVANAPAPAAV